MTIAVTKNVFLADRSKILLPNGKLPPSLVLPFDIIIIINKARSSKEINTSGSSAVMKGQLDEDWSTFIDEKSGCIS
jgi:hypothetical protein